MAGHSKWANIKRKKEVNDKAKSAVFAKLSRLITSAVAEGGGVTNPESNIKLRLMVEKARQENMPKENIARAIEKGAGSDKNQFSPVTYEAFGPSGSSFLILATTDNPNRTSNEMKNTLDRNGGKLGNPGSVSYLFDHCGVVIFDDTQNREEDVLNFAEKINALDMEHEEGIFIVYFPADQIANITSQMDNLIVQEAAKTIYKPHTQVSVSHEEAEKISLLIEALENLDDVYEVYTNAVES